MHTSSAYMLHRHRPETAATFMASTTKLAEGKHALGACCLRPLQRCSTAFEHATIFLREQNKSKF